MPEWMNEDFLESMWFVPVRIALIIAIALLVRAVANRMIERAVRTLVNGHRHERKTRPAPAALKVMAKAAPFSDARRQQRIGALGSLGRSTVAIVLLVVVTLTVLSELGFPISTLLAGTSLIGIAIAFGVQTILRDVISGIFMLIEDQFGMGDYVQVCDIDGIVEEVGLRLTQVRDEQGTIWYVRNGDISKVANYSQGNGRPSAARPAPAAAGERTEEIATS